MTNDGFVYFCGKYRNTSQKVPKLVEGIENVRQMHAYMGFKFITVLISDKIYKIFESNEVIETDFDNCIQFYAEEYDLTYKSLHPYNRENYYNISFDVLTAIDHGHFGAVSCVIHKLDEKFYSVKKVEHTGNYIIITNFKYYQ